MHVSRLDSGLTVAEHGSDAVAVQRALQEHDRDLRLIPQESDHYGRIVYKVARLTGGDRPVQWVMSWRTRDGEALPLSMRLVDKVKELDLNSRAPKDDPDDLNAQVRAERERDLDREMENLSEDWQRKHGQPILHRSQSLRLARDKRRARGENV